MLRDYDGRQAQYLKDYWVSVETRNKLTEEQLKLLSNPNNKLVAGEDMAVYLPKIDCQQLITGQQPYTLLQCESALSFSDHSRLGTQFVVNVEELALTAQTYFYNDEELLSQVRAAAAQFNMAVSFMWAFQQYAQGHRDCLLAVGKARMRENQRVRALVLENRVFSTSLLNLVTADDIQEVVKTPQGLQGAHTKLAKLLIEMARPLARKQSG